MDTAFSSQQLAFPQGDNVSQDLKIQMCITGFPWADVKHAPEFKSYDDARKWLEDNAYDKLESDGLNFRVMPKDHPCEFVATLERNGV